MALYRLERVLYKIFSKEGEADPDVFLVVKKFKTASYADIKERRDNEPERDSRDTRTINTPG